MCCCQRVTYHAFTVCASRARGKRSRGSGRTSPFTNGVPTVSMTSAPPSVSEGVPLHVTESSEHLEVPGQPEVTSGTRSDMDTRAPGGKESRRADAAEMGERGTPPQRQLPGERTAGQPEVPGQPEVTQRGKEEPRARMRRKVQGARGAATRRNVREARSELAASRLPDNGMEEAASERGTASSDGSRASRQKDSKGKARATAGRDGG